MVIKVIMTITIISIPGCHSGSHGSHGHRHHNSSDVLRNFCKIWRKRSRGTQMLQKGHGHAVTRQGHATAGSLRTPGLGIKRRLLEPIWHSPSSHPRHHIPFDLSEDPYNLLELIAICFEQENTFSFGQLCIISSIFRNPWATLRATRIIGQFDKTENNWRAGFTESSTAFPTTPS